LTSEQLQVARAEKWRQKANPLLTIEDAEAWIESTGVSLFLPRKTQLQSPAPSFVEAVLGETNVTPPPAAIQNAFDLATRLFAAEKATPLNLLGAASEQPDFLISPEALPYVFALRGDRDWKRGPREKSSPLVVESWKVLKREGALTVPELQAQLGREVTEGAVLRSLSELWTALRVLPVYIAGEATAWELFESRNQKVMQIGGGMAQATALSALISLYLDSTIAATSDDIETFLSPLAPRSRIREVAHGLATTRQLLTITLGTQSLLHIAGGLPEFPEIETPAEIHGQAEPQPDAAPPVRERRPFVPRDKREAPPQRFDRARKPFTPREGGDRPRRERPAFGDRPAARDARKSSSGFTRPASDGPRKEWKPRREGEFRPPRKEDRGGFGKPYRSRTSERPGDQSSGEKPPRREWKPREEKRPFEKKEWKPRREGAQEGRSEFRPRRAEGGGGFSKPYRSRTPDQRTGDQRTGEQRPFKKFPLRTGSADRPPRREWKPRGEEGERKEFRPRKTGESPERREFKPRPPAGRGFKPRREDGERKEFRPRKTGESPARGEFKPRPPAGRGFKPRREDSERKEFRPRRTGESPERREFKPRPPAGRGFKPRREEGERKEFRPRRTDESPERREFKPRPPAGRGFKPRREGSAFGDKRKPFGAKRPFESREGFDRKKPPQREGRAEGGDAERPKKSFSKPGFKSGKKFGSPKSGGRKPAFGAKRPSRLGGKRPNNRKGKKPGK
jgi:23S rRNA pseudouridine2605 synthase